MSKINPVLKPTPKADGSVRLAGGAGAPAAIQSNEALLRRVVLANLLWEKNAYVDGKTVASEIQRLIPLCNPEAVFDLAYEARKIQKLRHTPLFMAVEMCKHDGTRPYVGKLLPLICTRADMLTDFLALYWGEGKKPICNQAKIGLAAAFHNFNEYKLAKYDRNAAIKIRDVMFLCRPKPNSEYEEVLFKKVANRNLAVPETWETMLSAGKDKKETWTYLIKEKKIGGLAMLRNLNNMVKANVDKDVIVEGLKNLNGTMLLPLDFLKAARMTPQFKREIEDAMVESYKNLPKLPGKTLFIVDVSGSMGCLNSSGSTFGRMDHACAMAMLAANQCESFELVATAGDDWSRVGAHEWIQYPSKGFDLAEKIYETKHRIGGGGIFTKQCLEWCEKKFEDKKFDRIIVFSDSQDVDVVYAQREGKSVIPKPFGKYNYICDVSSERHGVNYRGCWTAEITGFSEHFITYIAAMEGIENTFEENN